MIRRDLGHPLAALTVAAVNTGYAARRSTLRPAPITVRPSDGYSALATLAVINGLLLGWLAAGEPVRPYDWEVDGL